MTGVWSHAALWLGLALVAAPDIGAALGLLLYPQRLVATLRV